MFGRSYAVMDRLPGYTLNELTYRRPEVLDESKITIAYQLGLHAAYAYVFGVKDGFQTNYIFNPLNKIVTRIDKENFLDVPLRPEETLSDGDAYTQEIAACELSNLKYIPSFRSGDDRDEILQAFRVGFTDKYEEIKSKKRKLMALVMDTRKKWAEVKPVQDMGEYVEETERTIYAVDALIDQDPGAVMERLLKAKAEVDGGGYRRK